jgi:hypothetical protein
MKYYIIGLINEAEKLEALEIAKIAIIGNHAQLISRRGGF